MQEQAANQEKIFANIYLTNDCIQTVSEESQLTQKGKKSIFKILV